MRHIVRRSLRRMAKRVQSSHLIRDLLRDQPAARELAAYIDSPFVDSQGNEHVRLKGYRETVVPQWRNMFGEGPPLAGAEADADSARRDVQELEVILQRLGTSLIGARILDVGCAKGRHACALMERGAAAVDGIDVADYSIRQNKGLAETPNSFSLQSARMAESRSATIKLFEKRTPSIGEKIQFFEQDVCSLDVQNEYDLIVSWETLEHIANPQTAIRNMWRALKPEGICFHHYNPFFCVEGGHSLCTLDFPWGHARLSDADFGNYIETFRPEEYIVSLPFFTKSLNRMTLAEAQEYVLGAGFEILAFCPWPSAKDLEEISPDILSQCKRLYPSVTIQDLISRVVWLSLRKPDSKALPTGPG
jgi:2-polyprenyl-3-methyl-5-hydroxy-6-metoxy-1,4-benzoquinol methylase